jgi:hypothetical protein
MGRTECKDRIETDKPTILDKVTQSPPQQDQQDSGTFKQTEAGHAHGQNQLIDDSGQQHLSNVPSATMTPTDSTTTTIQIQPPNVTGTADPWSY